MNDNMELVSKGASSDHTDGEKSNPSNTSPICDLCREGQNPDVTIICGSLSAPLMCGNDDGAIYVHQRCVQFSGMIPGEEDHAIVDMAMRARFSTCTWCGGMGASVRCALKGCKSRSVYHLRCAVASLRTGESSMLGDIDFTRHIVLCQKHKPLENPSLVERMRVILGDKNEELLFIEGKIRMLAFPDPKEVRMAIAVGDGRPDAVGISSASSGTTSTNIDDKMESEEPKVVISVESTTSSDDVEMKTSDDVDGRLRRSARERRAADGNMVDWESEEGFDDSFSEAGSVSSHESLCHECGGVGQVMCCQSCTNVYHPTCLDPRVFEIPEGDWYCPVCEFHHDICEVCKDGGNLIACDTCSSVYHLTCLPKGSRLMRPPKGEWQCPKCVLRKHTPCYECKEIGDDLNRFRKCARCWAYFHTDCQLPEDIQGKPEAIKKFLSRSRRDDFFCRDCVRFPNTLERIITWRIIKPDEEKKEEEDKADDPAQDKIDEVKPDDQMDVSEDISKEKEPESVDNDGSETDRDRKNREIFQDVDEKKEEAFDVPVQKLPPVLSEQAKKYAEFLEEKWKESEQKIREPLNDPLAEVEFLVRWRDRSFRAVSWIPGDWMKRVFRGKTSVFCRQNDVFDSEPIDISDIIDPEWTRVGRVVAMDPRREKEYIPMKDQDVLVKWRGLGYEDATWESLNELKKDSDFQVALKRFLRFEKLARQKEAPKIIAKDFREFTEQPDILESKTLKLHSYQLDGLNWLRYSWYNDTNVILGDEMGLGKTIQSIAFLLTLWHYEGLRRPFLVIAPLSTIENWIREFEDWAPQVRYFSTLLADLNGGLNVIVHSGNAKARELIRASEWRARARPGEDIGPVKINVIITSYELIMVDMDHFRKLDWACVIIDEGHRMKSSSSKFTKMLNKFSKNQEKQQRSMFRLLLTGTPIQNTIDELLILLNFLDPVKFPLNEETLEKFGQGLNDPKDKKKIIDELHELLRPHLLRRLKKDVMQSIPKKSELIVRVEMSEMQKVYYKAILAKNFSVINRGANGQQKVKCLSILTELQKCCNHPYLFPNAEPEVGTEREEIVYERLITASGKMVLLDKMLRRLKETGHQVLLFCQMTRMLDILEDYCEYAGFRSLRIDGTVSWLDRQRRIDSFNALDSQTFIFLLSTKAARLGINLASADTVILYDSDWNPHNDIQALSRAHRIGQGRPVMVYQFVCSGGVEEAILRRARQKLILEHIVVEKMGTDKIDEKELDDIIEYGAADLFAEEIDEFKREKEGAASMVKEGGEGEKKEVEEKQNVYLKRLGLDDDSGQPTGLAAAEMEKEERRAIGLRTKWDAQAVEQLLDRSQSARVWAAKPGSGDADNADAVQSTPVEDDAQTFWKRVLAERHASLQGPSSPLGRGMRKKRHNISYKESDMFPSVAAMTTFVEEKSEDGDGNYSPVGVTSSSSDDDTVIDADLQIIKKPEKRKKEVQIQPDKQKKRKSADFTWSIGERRMWLEYRKIQISSLIAYRKGKTRGIFMIGRQGWAKYFDPVTKKLYCHHAGTNKTQWETPIELNEDFFSSHEHAVLREWTSFLIQEISHPQFSIDALEKVILRLNEDLETTHPTLSRQMPSAQTAVPRQMPYAQTFPTAFPRQMPSAQTAVPLQMPSAQTAVPRQMPSAQTAVPHQMPSAQTAVPRQMPPAQTAMPHQMPSAQTAVSHQMPSAQAAVPHQIPSAQTAVPHQMPSAQTAVPHQMPSAETSISSNLHSSIAGSPCPNCKSIDGIVMEMGCGHHVCTKCRSRIGCVVCSVGTQAKTNLIDSQAQAKKKLKGRKLRLSAEFLAQLEGSGWVANEEPASRGLYLVDIVSKKVVWWVDQWWPDTRSRAIPDEYGMYYSKPHKRYYFSKLKHPEMVQWEVPVRKGISWITLEPSAAKKVERVTREIYGRHSQQIKSIGVVKTGIDVIELSSDGESKTGDVAMVKGLNKAGKDEEKAPVIDSENGGKKDLSLSIDKESVPTDSIHTVVPKSQASATTTTKPSIDTTTITPNPAPAITPNPTTTTTSTNPTPIGNTKLSDARSAYFKRIKEQIIGEYAAQYKEDGSYYVTLMELCEGIENEVTSIDNLRGKIALIVRNKRKTEQESKAEQTEQESKTEQTEKLSELEYKKAMLEKVILNAKKLLQRSFEKDE